MDAAALRAEAMALLQRLGSRPGGMAWTDFNAHDPGVTVLEALCYAITDLAYRTNHPVPDLLAASADPGLPGPTQVLPSDPVTIDDLARVALDLAGTDHAWVGAPDAGLEVYFHEPSGQIRLRPEPAEAEPRPLVLRGLVSVAVRGGDDFAGDAALATLARRLQASRPLGIDLDVRWIRTQPVVVQAVLEVAPCDDPTALLADVIERIEDCLAPPARFTGWAEARATGAPLDALLSGPLLGRGVLAGLPAQPAQVFASDLIHAITDVGLVRAVRSVTPQTVDIPAGTLARLDQGSTIMLLRGGLPLRADSAAAWAQVEQRRRARRAAQPSLALLDPPRGRDRQLARYHSVQRELPAVYGVGPLGLAGPATAARRAQVRQLQAYLLLFDQMLADRFAQLANAHRLLSPDVGGVASYFHQPVNDPPLVLDDLLLPAAAAPDGAATDDLARRRRMLAHLLARFGEQVGEHSQWQQADEGVIVAARQAWLARAGWLAQARGRSADLAEADAAGPIALAQRLRLKLGLPDLAFHIVEHVLLRPVADDAGQIDADGSTPVPLLAAVAGPDPWSLQLSFVFHRPAAEADRDGTWFDGLSASVAGLIVAEAPAHLRCSLHWLDDDAGADGSQPTWAAFDAAWAAFQARLRDLRWPVGGTPDPLAALRLRDARDTVTELLGLGRAWPLRNIPWTQRVVVAAGKPATLQLAYSQPGVLYALREAGGAPVLAGGQPVQAVGDGGPLSFETPPVQDDTVYRILATRRGAADAPPRQAWLLGEAAVQEGIDTTLVAQITGQPLLDARIDAPLPADARLVAFGAAVQVLIRSSQEGVDYSLRDAAAPDAVLSDAVTGTSGDILLTLPRASADLDLRLHATKLVGDPNRPQRHEALLDAVLPLRVRADPSPAAVVEPLTVDFGAGALVQLATSQAGTRYRVWRRSVQDAEYWFPSDGPAATLAHPGDTRQVQVRWTAPVPAWEPPAGFAPARTVAEGSGDALEVQAGPFEAAALLLVQATREHAVRPLAAGGTERITSTVLLDQALLVLARPDAARVLQVQAIDAADPVAGRLVVTDGAPGVVYGLAFDDRVDPPQLYIHQRDAFDPLRNRGIGQLRLAIDLSVVQAGPDAGTAPPLTIPPPPQLTLAELGDPADGVRFALSARVALSGAETTLKRALVWQSAPRVETDPAAPAVGEGFAVVVADSAGERLYTLVDGDKPLAGPVPGVGGPLKLDAGLRRADGVYSLVITPRDDDAEVLPLTHTLHIPLPAV